MSRRSTPLATLLLVGVCLAVVPACKKKPAAEPAPNPAAGPTPPGAAPGMKRPGAAPGTTPETAPAAPSGTTPAAPPAVSSDHLLFAHLRAKDLRDSALFAELKQAAEKAGGAADWQKVEGQPIPELGIGWTDVDSVTACVPDAPAHGEPRFVVILTTTKPIDKSAVTILRGAQPDARGLYKAGEALVHFPDEQTLAAFHPDLAQQYLDGYARNKSGWPLTADLAKAAAANTLYVAVNAGKAPREALQEPGLKEFAGLLSARTVSVAANLRGKELSAAVRATYPDAATAGQVKETVQQYVGLAATLIDQFARGTGTDDLTAFAPAVAEARRALKEMKIEVSGTDVTAATSYRANFDVARMVFGAVQKVREAAARMTVSNNLKQVGLALHSLSDAGGVIPVHGVGPKGQPLRTANDKPLLSWRVAILPYIEQGNLYKQFKLDEPWDSAHNIKLVEQMPKLFAAVGTADKPGYTRLQMAVGPSATPLPSLRLAAITDGTSNTIAVAEAAEPVIWTKPDDIMLLGRTWPNDFRKKFGGQFAGGFHAVLWDGSVRFLPDAMSDTTLALALCPSDGQPLPADWDNAPAPPRPPGPTGPKRPNKK
jgi:hypothetical protein